MCAIHYMGVVKEWMDVKPTQLGLVIQEDSVQKLHQLVGNEDTQHSLSSKRGYNHRSYYQRKLGLASINML